ncbi:MAG: hypothetical protein MK106_09350, partial [Mariniblastus sp.]|nr:hypothetical protein [Mariniblastus sp.]
MNGVFKKIIGMIAVAGSLLSANTVLGQQTENDRRAQINSANQLLVEGNVDQALAQYAQVVDEAQVDHELTYNRAIARYRKGELAAARELFTTMLATTNTELAAKANFNLGNCDYSAAVANVEQDRSGAIQQLKSAIEHYRRALRVNRNDTDARANIELATQLVEQWQDQEQQDQEQQDQEQQDQEQQNQEQQNQEQQDQDQQDQEQQDQE